MMLSGESANGQYPELSVSTQASICAAAEAWVRKVGYSAGSFENITLHKLEGEKTCQLLTTEVKEGREGGKE